jgi:hypothetical protein
VLDHQTAILDHVDTGLDQATREVVVANARLQPHRAR